tara:strand:+ start:19624 stop:22191 length:2568 start_codon:yes stop_codon:yes gene_type:complete
MSDRASEFDEQALLTFKIKELAPIHNSFYSACDEDEGNKSFGPYEKVNLLKGTSAEVINKIVNSDFFRKRPLLDLTTAQLSELVPQLRFFKNYYDDNLNFVKEVEFKFPAYRSIEDASVEALSRGREGFGLESFEISSEGTNFFESDKFFGAKMVLFFQSMDELLEKRISLTGDDYSFLDLIVLPVAKRPSSGKIDEPESGEKRRERYPTRSPELYEVKVTFGWSMGEITPSSAFSKLNQKEQIGFKNAIDSSKFTFILSLLDHNLTINEDGTIRLDISYNGRIDMINFDIRSNILYDDNSIKKINSITNEIKALSTRDQKTGSKGQEDTRQKVKSLQTQRQEVIEEAKTTSYSSIVQALLSPGETQRSRIFTVSIDPDIIDDFKSDPKRKVTSNGQTKAVVDEIKFSRLLDGLDPCDDVEYNIFTPISRKGSTVDLETILGNPVVTDQDGKEYVNITWFYLGDLFDILAKRSFRKRDSADGKYKFGDVAATNTKIALSDFEMIDYITGEPIKLNLAHVPVSMQKFSDFFNQRIIKNNSDLSYTMNQFMVDFLNYLVPSIFLNDGAYNGTYKQKINFIQTITALPSSDGNLDPLRVKANQRKGSTTWSTINVNKINISNFISSFKNSNVDVSQYHYYIIIHAESNLNASFSGNPDADEQLGIPHLYVARDRGLLRRANFNKSDIKYLREMRIAAQAWDPIVQLSSRYNASVELFGAAIFTPGMYVYINPTGFGSTKLGSPTVKNSIADIMGLGGYHMVHKVSHSITPGKFETKLEALHEKTATTTDGISSFNTPLENVISITDEDEKCGSNSLTRPQANPPSDQNPAPTRPILGATNQNPFETSRRGVVGLPKAL